MKEEERAEASVTDSIEGAEKRHPSRIVVVIVAKSRAEASVTDIRHRHPSRIIVVIAAVVVTIVMAEVVIAVIVVTVGGRAEASTTDIRHGHPKNSSRNSSSSNSSSSGRSSNSTTSNDSTREQRRGIRHGQYQGIRKEASVTDNGVAGFVLFGMVGTP